MCDVYVPLIESESERDGERRYARDWMDGQMASFQKFFAITLRKISAVKLLNPD